MELNFQDLNNDNNIKCIKYFKETWCGWYGVLYKLDEDRIIVNDKVTIHKSNFNIKKIILKKLIILLNVM